MKYEFSLSIENAICSLTSSTHIQENILAKTVGSDQTVCIPKVVQIIEERILSQTISLASVQSHCSVTGVVARSVVWPFLK